MHRGGQAVRLPPAEGLLVLVAVAGQETTHLRVAEVAVAVPVVRQMRVVAKAELVIVVVPTVQIITQRQRTQQKKMQTMVFLEIMEWGVAQTRTGIQGLCL